MGEAGSGYRRPTRRRSPVSIDRQIAEVVMGWTFEDDLHYRDHADCYVTDGRPFLPSSNWADAGLVVEKMRERGWEMVLNVVHNSSRAKFLRGIPHGYAEAEADTAPLAICRAALAAMKGE